MHGEKASPPPSDAGIEGGLRFLLTRPGKTTTLSGRVPQGFPRALGFACIKICLFYFGLLGKLLGIQDYKIRWVGPGMRSHHQEVSFSPPHVAVHLSPGERRCGFDFCHGVAEWFLCGMADVLTLANSIPPMLLRAPLARPFCPLPLVCPLCSLPLAHLLATPFSVSPMFPDRTGFFACNKKACLPDHVVVLYNYVKNDGPDFS